MLGHLGGVTLVATPFAARVRAWLPLVLWFTYLVVAVGVKLGVPIGVELAGFLA